MRPLLSLRSLGLLAIGTAALAAAMAAESQPAPAPTPTTAAATPAAAATSAPLGKLRFHFDPVREPVEVVDVDPRPPLVLPDFEVRDARLNLSERDVLTQKGLLSEAKQKYLSPVYQKTLGQLAAVAAFYFNPLAIFGGWHPNDGEAAALYQEDERLRRRRDSEALIDLYQVDDPETYQEMRDLLDESFRREQPPQSISIPLN